MFAVVVCGCLSCPASAQAFDLAAYRQLAAADREAGIEKGRSVLAAGILDDDPKAKRTLLWYMGGAAIGTPDDVALGEVVLQLERLAEAGDTASASFAGFLRGARLIDLGRHGDGLIQVLQAANRLVTHEDLSLGIVAASELCRAYIHVDRLDQALAHCRRHTRLVRDSGDPMALARAEYMQASVLSMDGRFELAIPLWRNARERFSKAGLTTLAGRAAGSLAGDLIAIGDYSEALPMARQAVAAGELAGNSISVAISRGVVAQALAGLEHSDRALTEIDHALAQMRQLDQPDVLAALLETRLELLAEKEGDSTRVIALRDKLDALSVQQANAQETDTISNLEQRYKQRGQALRIRELENENRSRELELQASRDEAKRRENDLHNQRIITSLSILAAFAFLGGLLAVAALLRTQRRLAASLHEQAYRDALTGLPNRRALFERMQALLAAPDAGDSGHALLMIDIDHFKAINDSGGHPFGDSVLIRIGACFRQHVSADVLVARLGGEEFVVLCLRIGQVDMLARAEVLRKAVRALDVRLDGRLLPLTVSIGVALYDGMRCNSVSSWLGAADKAVYRAKQGGRDRVE